MTDILAIKNDTLLNEIRTQFSEFAMFWDENFKQGDADIRALSLEGPWQKTERDKRIEEGRLCEHHDIISQYNRRMFNNSLLNARGFKIEPSGEKATPETAGLREDRMRQIEYESNAKYARENALENAIDRGMGFYIVRTEYGLPDSFDQKIVIDAILNPKSVLIWPYCKTPERSDQQASFVVERYSHDVFRQKYPRATVQSFGADILSLAPQWITGKDVQVCSYFKVKTTERHLLQIEGPGGKRMKMFADSIPEAKVKKDEWVFPNGKSVKIIRERWSPFPKVFQYMTNGVEILDTKEWVGTTIPIVCVFGKEKYGEDGTLIVESATRKARTAQLAYDYAWTNQLESIGQIPKAKIWMVEGQQETSTDYENLNRVPTAYATYKATTTATGSAILPPPIILPYAPDIQGPEIVKQSAMIAIENAYGISSIQHQDKVAKSGKAMKELTAQADVTNFHFQNASDRALLFEERIVNEILDKVEDTETVRGMRNAEGAYRTEMVSPKEDPESGDIVDHPYGDAGAHDVTLSIQKAYGSQFEKYTESLDALAQDPIYGPVLTPLIIKARELGPLGEKMYELAKSLMPPEARRILDGDKNGPDPAQIQQQAEQLNQALQAATQEIHSLKDHIAAKQAEIDAKLQMNEADNATKLAVANISAKVEKSALDVEVFLARMEHMLELLMQGRDHAQQSSQQDQQLDHAAEQGAQQAQLTREGMAQQESNV